MTIPHDKIDIKLFKEVFGKYSKREAIGQHFLYLDGQMENINDLQLLDELIGGDEDALKRFGHKKNIPYFKNILRGYITKEEYDMYKKKYRLGTSWDIIQATKEHIGLGGSLFSGLNHLFFRPDLVR